MAAPQENQGSHAETDLKLLEGQLFDRLEHLNPNALKEAARGWAHAIAKTVGRDDGSRDLKIELAPFIATVNQHSTIGSAKIILNEISEAVEAQWDLAKHLHDVAKDNHYSGHAAPLLVDENYPESQWIGNPVALIEFLKKPLSSQTMAQFQTAQPSFPPERTAQFYQSFWSLSNNQRAEFLGKVVKMPATKADFRFGMILNQLKGFIGSGFGKEFLPPDNPARGEDAAHQIGAKIIGAFLSHPPEPKLLMRSFASMLDAIHDDLQDQASSHPRATDPNERFGYRLGKFMNNLGPGASKTAQFGHSLSVTPDTWIPGLSTSKSDAGSPSRYEYLSWIRDRVSPAVRDHITHVGAHKGTGSYLCTYGVELDQGYIRDNPNYARYRDRYTDKNLVLSMKKPHAREDSLEFTNYLLELGQRIGAINPQAARSVAPLIELVKQGTTMVEKETDLNYSARQEALTGQLYEDLKIQLGSNSGNYTADFYTQGAFDHGDDFRVSLCVDGPHFNQLPEETASQKAIKRRAALSFFTPALYIMLSGRPFNHDDHGDNNGVVIDDKNIHIGKFDSGAQALEKPTTEQKIVFADCLVNALLNSARNKYGLFSSLKHTIARTSTDLGQEREQELDYINSMLRATVSLGDYMRYMKPNDYKHAFLAVAETGEIDPVILSRICERVTAVGVEKSSRLPIVGPIARGLASLANITGMAQCSLAQQLSESLRRENDHAEKFYPDNPNPHRKRRATPTDQPAQDTEQAADNETIRLRIKGTKPDEKPGFAGKILRAAAGRAKNILE